MPERRKVFFCLECGTIKPPLKEGAGNRLVCKLCGSDAFGFLKLRAGEAKLLIEDQQLRRRII